MLRISRKLRQFTRTLRIPLHLAHARRRLAELHSQPRSPEEFVSWIMDLGIKSRHLSVKMQ